MMFFIVAMFMMVLGVLTFHLYLSSVFNTSHRAFRFAFYVLLVFLGPTIVVGLFQVSNSGYETVATP